MSNPSDHLGQNARRQPPQATLRMRSTVSLIAIDLLSIFGGFGVIIIARTMLFGGTEWRFLVWTLLPLHVLVAFNNHAYEIDNLQYPLRATRRGLQAVAIAIAATILIGFSLKASQSLPRLVTIVGFLLTSGLMFLGRYSFAQHFEAVIGGNPFNVMVICDGEQVVSRGRFSIIMAAETGFDPEAHDPLMYDRLAKKLHGVDRVVIACPVERRVAWAHSLKGMSVQGEIILPEFVALAPLGMDFYGHVPTMVVSSGPLGLIDRAFKRCFDLCFVCGALILLSPIMACTAIAIKLESPGPVLFRQTRIGRDNKMFRVFKFRSMQVDATDGEGCRSAARDDDRVTRVGRIIRATSIDELPQLLNVLTGDMSIVGPRPHALGSRAADKLFWEVDQRYWHRHAAKPGLTGLAQVRGFRGATLVEEDLSNRLHADLEYLERWTIWRDVKIVLMTFRVLLHRNAF